MTDFLKESRKASVDKSFKELEQQRINQMKAFEKWDITNNFAPAAREVLNSEKSKRKKQVKQDRSDTSAYVNVGLVKIEETIKGKMVKGLREAYDKENKNLLKL